MIHPLLKLEGALVERAFDDDFVLGSPSLVLARRAFFSSPPTAPALRSVLFLRPSPGRSPERLSRPLCLAFAAPSRGRREAQSGLDSDWVKATLRAQKQLRVRGQRCGISGEGNLNRIRKGAKTTLRAGATTLRAGATSWD